MKEIGLGRAEEFAMEMQTLRRNFPELRREIDKCIFDVAQNFIGSCGEVKCNCSMSFAEFHALQNAIFERDGEKL